MFQIQRFLISCLIISAFAGSSAILSDSEEKSATLTNSEEKLVRDIVYGKQTGTAVATEGKYAKWEILAIPPDLKKLYDKKPAPTLDLLYKIMVGGSPRDSNYAAACACTLFDDNPVLGAAIRRTATAKTYDVVDEYWEETPRQHNIRVFLELQREKKEKDKKAPVKKAQH